MGLTDTRDATSRLGGGGIALSWIFVFIWCAFTFPAFYSAAFEAQSVQAGLVSGLFALIGVGLLWTTARMTLDWKKFGVASLTPRHGAPARPGGRFVAQLRIHEKTPEAREIEAEIRCRRVTWIKDSRGRTGVTEETVWTSRKGFPLRKTGLGANAEIVFDIPTEARPTDLPEEHDRDSERERFRREGQEPWHFHRWEVTVVAKVPGIDLDRSFSVVIEPDVAATTTDTQGAVAAAPPARSIQDSNWFKTIAVLGFLGVMFGPAAFFLAPHIIVGSPAPGSLFPVSLSLAEYVVPEPVLPPKTPWITDTSTWSMPMPAFAPYLGIAANGIRTTRVNGQEIFSFDEIVIEKNPGRAEVTYFELIFSVTYHDQESDDTRSAGGFSKGIENIRGKLTAENPVLVLRNLAVEGPHPKGHIASTRYYLAVNAVSGHRKYVHEMSRKITSR